ncbi:MAG: GEVED domain-containing protein, partial [Planctomycetota bacterium]|nr:GEVED domain-containing protein [Planctomycetota bacterium]
AFVDALVRGNTDVTVEVTASTGGYGGGLLNAWIDFDGDGIFDVAAEDGDYSELIISNQVLVDGANLIDFSIPADAQLGATYARFRYSYEGNLGPNGAAIAGEVEDYRIDASFGGGILDDQPYANNDTFTATQGDIAVNLDVLSNDFGSSNGGPTLVVPAVNPIATDQGGTALVNLATGRIFYTPADGFTGADTFDYEVTDGGGNFDTGTVTVHVQPQFTDPLAIDDYQVILDTTVGGETDIAVLDNDIQGAFPPLSIVSWTDGNHGDVVLDGDNLTYVRTDSDPYTLDTFTYTVAGSAAGQPTSTATVTVQLAENVDTVEYVIEALSPLSGLPMADGAQVVEGDQFTLRVSVRDTRSAVAPADAGVYAAYVDMLYDTDHLQVVAGSLNHGTIFTDITQGNATVPGLINEVGGVQDGVDQSTFDRGNNTMEVFTIDVIAVASTNGELTLLETDPVDVTPLHDTVVIAPTPSTIPALQIDYNSTSIEILGAEGESLLDTNRDGAVTPIDALGIINQLNSFGTGAVAEGETFGLDQAMDVNRDSFVSPLDALAIINYLNDNTSEMGEGEAVQIVEQSTIDTMIAGNEISATDAVSAEVIDEYLRVRENQIGLSYFTGGSQDVVEEDSSELESTLDELADDVFGQW